MNVYGQRMSDYSPVFLSKLSTWFKVELISTSVHYTFHDSYSKGKNLSKEQCKNEQSPFKEKNIYSFISMSR